MFPLLRPPFTGTSRHSFTLLSAFLAISWMSRATPAEAARSGTVGPRYQVGLTEGIAPGEIRTTIHIAEPGGTSWIWVYHPARAPNPGIKLPLVMMAPGGSALVTGMVQGELNRPFQLPFARAGFVVAGFSLDGYLADISDTGRLAGAAQAFRKAKLGLLNFEYALRVVLAAVPGVDPARIYVVGHSSAGTLALQIAEHEPGVAACVAFAPVASYVDWGHRTMLDTVEPADPGFKKYYFSMDPMKNTAQLRCPLLVFHADDDQNVSLDDNSRFVSKLQRTNHRVNFVRVPSGGHTMPVINLGIPLAIHWLESRPETAPGAGP